MSSCHSRQCQCSLANQPTGGTLVQDVWLPFGDRTNLCDKFRVHSLEPKSQTLHSFQIFQLVIYPAELILFKFPYHKKMKLFLFPPLFFCFCFCFSSKDRRIQFIIRGGVVFGFYPLHEICYKYTLPKS